MRVKILGLAVLVSLIGSVLFLNFNTSKADAPTAGLAGYWNFNEGSGTLAADSSGNANNGTLVNDPSWTSGQVGSAALSFDGSNDYVNAGSGTSLDNIQSQGGGGMTVAFWVKPTTNATKILIAKGLNANNNGNWYIQKSASTNPARLVFVKEGATDMNVNYNSVLASGSWTHIVLTWDGTMQASGVNVYKNGSLITKGYSTNGATPNSDAANNLTIGGVPGGTFSDAVLDEVRIYNRVLTAQEAVDVYTDIGVTDTTPPNVSNGSPTGILPAGTTQTTLFVATNENATCKYDTMPGVEYASMANAFATTGATSHSQSLTGLTDGSSYTYYIRCQDVLGNTNAADYVVSFSIAEPDSTPPVISSVFASNITSSSATISWSTDEAADSQVEYGLTQSYGSQTALDANLLTSHSQNLLGLTASTTYHFFVKSKDLAGNLATSTDYTFTTNPTPSCSQNTLTDFRDGAEGNVLTAAPLNSSAFGVLGNYWSVSNPGSYLTFSSGAGHIFGGQNPNFCNNPWPGDGAPMGVNLFVADNAYRYAKFTYPGFSFSKPPTPTSTATLGMWFKTDYPSNTNPPPNIDILTSVGYGLGSPNYTNVAFQGNGGFLRLSLETASNPGTGCVGHNSTVDAITINSNAWYWITIQYSPDISGIMNKHALWVYDEGLNKIGEIYATSCKDHIPWYSKFGFTGAPGTAYNHNLMFDNVMMCYKEDCAFPLLPQQ